MSLKQHIIKFKRNLKNTNFLKGIFYGSSAGFMLAIIGLSKLLRVKTETYDRFIIPKGDLIDVIVSVLIFMLIGAIIGGFGGYSIKKSK